MVGFANRNLVFEQRASANQVALDPGLRGRRGRASSGRRRCSTSDAPIGADCAPDADAGQLSFREHLLAYDAESRRFMPRTWSDAGSRRAAAGRLRARRSEARLVVQLPARGPSALDVPPAVGTASGVRGPLRCRRAAAWCSWIATGCEHFAADCLPGWGGTASGTATARVQVTLALLPALATVPASALTAVGDIVGRRGGGACQQRPARRAA